MAQKGTRAPSILDVYIGRRVRARRLALSMTLDDFAGPAELTIQQIQKYESGLNRISVARLGQFSEILNCSPGHFYVGAEILREVFSDPSRYARIDLRMARDVCDLLSDYLTIDPGAGREQILEAVRGAAKGGVKDRPAEIFVERLPPDIDLDQPVLLDFPHPVETPEGAGD